MIPGANRIAAINPKEYSWTMSRYILGIALILALFLPVTAEDYEVTVTTVTVWVKATDGSGKPAMGLTKGDFELLEDGQKVSLTCFEETALASSEGVASPQVEQTKPTVPDANRKQIVFLFDLENTSQNEFVHLKKKAGEFLEQLSKSWDITLVSLIPGAMNVDVERSQDPVLIRTKLDKITANNFRDLEALKNRRELGAALRNARGLPKDKVPQVIGEFCTTARDYALLEKRQSMGWMNSLRQFDQYIKKQTPDVHKVVLFFSGGISSNPGRQYFDMIRQSDLMRDLVRDEFDAAREFPECEDEGGNDLQKDFKKLVGQLNRYNITFYSVSSRGPINDLLETVRERDRQYKPGDLDFLKEYQDFLAVIADETGGVYFGNSLNFKRGFDAILSDLNHQYLLCYKPPVHKKEGHHSIKVKSQKPGVKLRHRSGYFD